MKNKNISTIATILFCSLTIFNTSCKKDNDDIDPDETEETEETENTFTDFRDDKVYKIITIGTDTWFAENFAYNTGKSGSWAYDNDESNVATYGRLYTYQSALDACPTGWHLPSDEEWKTLEMYLGMSQAEADFDGSSRGEGIGDKLKSTTEWCCDGEGNNTSGFTAMPGGFCDDGDFEDMTTDAYFWTSTNFESEDVWIRRLEDDSDGVSRYTFFDYANHGLSVRYFKD